ncbi:unnamed protein product, partial [Prorocentrum cordatum]
AAIASEGAALSRALSVAKRSGGAEGGLARPTQRALEEVKELTIADQRLSRLFTTELVGFKKSNSEGQCEEALVAANKQLTESIEKLWAE